MAISMLFIVCIFLALIGLVLALYAAAALYKYMRIQNALILKPLISIKTEILEIEKVSRFRWTEYLVKAKYEFEGDCSQSFGENIYLKGEKSFTNRNEAYDFEKIVSERKGVFVAANDTSIVAIFPFVEASYKKHLYGLTGSGLILFVTCIILVGFFSGH